MRISIEINDNLGDRLLDYAKDSQIELDTVLERLIATLPVRANFKIANLNPEQEGDSNSGDARRGDR